MDRPEGSERLGAVTGHTGVRRGAAIVGIVAIAAASFIGGAQVAAGGEDDDTIVGPAPQTTKKLMWGPTADPEGNSLFPMFRDLGVGIYGTTIRWDHFAKRKPQDPTNPNDPAYNWQAYVDPIIKEATKYGMKVQIMLLGAPRWANGGRSWPWAPADPQDFGDFAAAAAKRYPKVDLWMMWGEPNRTPNFKPSTPVKEGNETGPLTKQEQVSPRKYAEMVDAAYEAMKAVDPKNKIIAGNTYTSAGIDDINPYQWIENMKLPDGSRPRMDMWGHNPFGFAKPDLDDDPSRKGVVAFADLRRLAEVLDENFPGKPLPLYLAEWGVPFGFKDLDIGYQRNEEDAEEWIKAGFEIAREWPRIYTLGWIHPVDGERSSMGLLDKDYEQKPTYEFYKEG